MLDAVIDGHGPYTILFDTGANSIISEDLATALGLKKGAGANLNGFGGTATANRAILDRVQIGALTLTDQTVYITPFPYTLAHMARRPVVAAFGEDLLRSLSIRIDSTSHRITFYSPSRFIPPSRVQPTLLHFDSEGVSVDALVDGVPGRLHLDTGQDVSLTLYSGFVRDNDLVARFHALNSGVSGQGFGGETRAFITRTPSIDIGGVVVRDLVARLSTDTRGIAAGGAAGNLGMGFLKRFTVTFDAARSRVYFEPNLALRSRDPFNRAGLQLEEQPDGAHIVQVFPNSPAAKVGLRQGDVILAANGQTPDDEETFDSVFLQRPGTMVTLKIRGRRRPLALVLRDVL